MDGVLSLIGMLAVTVGVLALAYGCTRLLGRWSFHTGAQPAKGRQLQVLEQLPVGKDQRLLVVRVGERYLLLGAAPSGITQLVELSAEEVQRWQAQQSEESGARPSFREALRENLHKRNQ